MADEQAKQPALGEHAFDPDQADRVLALVNVDAATDTSDLAAVFNVARRAIYEIRKVRAMADVALFTRDQVLAVHTMLETREIVAYGRGAREALERFGFSDERELQTLVFNARIAGRIDERNLCIAAIESLDCDASLEQALGALRALPKLEHIGFEEPAESAEVANVEG